MTTKTQTPVDTKAKAGPGPAVAPTPQAGPTNVDAEQAAQRQRAMISLSAVPSRWRIMGLGVFDLEQPPLAAFTPDMFKYGAYALLHAAAKEDPKPIYDALGGDEARKPYQKAFLEALQDHNLDNLHLKAIETATLDFVDGGDLEFDTAQLLGNYPMLTATGKKYVQRSQSTLKLREYITSGTCAGHGSQVATHALIGTNTNAPAIMQASVRGAEHRMTGARGLAGLLANGTLGMQPQKEGAKDAAKPDAAKTDPAQPGGAPGADPKKAVDPNIQLADDLGKRITTAIDLANKNGHDQKLDRKTFKTLIDAVEAASPAVKDLLYARGDLMSRLIQLGDADQSKELVTKLDTVEDLYMACQKVQMQRATGAHAELNQLQGSPQVYQNIFNFLVARPGVAAKPIRLRVLQHEHLKVHHIDRMSESQKHMIYRLVSSGTTEPSTVESIRDCAKLKDGAGCARGLMKLASEDQGRLEELKEDHLFRLDIEKMDKVVKIDGGLEVNPHHLCLTMWGLKPKATDDPEGRNRQTEIDPDGTYTPLKIGERLELEDAVLNPAARALRSEVSRTIVWDDNMVNICRNYQNKAAGEKWVAMFRRLGKGSGTALVEQYTKLYPSHNLRGEIAEYVSGVERMECERILGFRVDSATVGVVGGKSKELGKAPPQQSEEEKAAADQAKAKEKKKIDLAQALRETKHGSKALAVITHETGELFCNWMFEIQGANWMMQPSPIPGCSKEELLQKWHWYRDLINVYAPQLETLAGIPKEQIHPIELLNNVVMEKGGDLAHKIQRFFGPWMLRRTDNAKPILADMKLRPTDFADRTQQALDQDKKNDPNAKNDSEEMARTAYDLPAKNIFQMIAELPADLNPFAVFALQGMLLRFKDAQLAGAPEQTDNKPASVEERPPRSFKGYYRMIYGIDPMQQLGRVLRVRAERDPIRTRGTAPTRR